MKKRIIAIVLSILQICFLVFISPVTAVAEPATFSLGNDNSLLLPTYSKAVTNSYNDSPDWLSTAIINEIRLETATNEGTLTAAIEVLDYYEQLGINCLWVTPVNETPIGNGYTNNGLHTINLELAEANTYEDGWKNFGKFVEAAHNRNIRILLDVIIWGVHYDAPMVTDPAYSGVVSNNENKWGGWSYNYGSDAFVNYYTNTMLDIIETTNIDGLRVDLAPFVDGCSSLLGGIRKKAFEKGHSIVIMSELNSNDRTGGTSDKVYDFEQVGVLDYANKDYWTDEFLTQHDFDSNSDNWELNVYGPPNWWLTTKSGRDIVSTTKSGSVYSGTKTEQTAVTGSFLGWNDREIQTGKNQYYTYAVSFHDQAAGKGTNVLSYGYSSIFAPVIPLWMAGDETGNLYGMGIANNLYFNSLVNTNLAATSQYSEFYQKIKRYIEIRRTYNDIFSYFPSNHRNTNICAVNVSGVSTYQAYARYANGKAVIILPNGTDSVADITAEIPLSEMGIASNYTITDLMTNEKLDVSNNRFTVTVESNDMAVILVDDGTTATTGCEDTVALNKATKTAYGLSDTGKAEALIKAIGTVTKDSLSAINAAENAYNSLPENEKVKVQGYADLLRAKKQYSAIIANGNDNNFAGILSDNDFYPNTKTYEKWGWSSVLDNIGETDNGGYNLNYGITSSGGGWSKDYRFEIMRPVSLDGASAQFTLNSSGTYYEKIFFLKISSNHMDINEEGDIGIKFDLGGGQIFFRTDDTACSHNSMVGYNASYPDRTFYSMGNKVTLNFKYADDGGLIININGTDFKISAEEFERAYGVKSADKVLFYVSPCDNSYPDITVDYLNSGEKEIQDSCNDYKLYDDNILPTFTGGYASWANHIKRSNTDSGLKIEYLTNLTTDYRLWTKNSYNMDGLHLKLTFDGTTYNDRMFFMTFTNSSTNSGNGLYMKIDSNGRQLFVGLDGSGWINTSGMPTTVSGYNDRVFDPAFKSDTIEILMLKQDDGGFIIDVNGYKFPVTAEQMASITSLTDTECAYVGFSPIGSYPKFTVNYLHSGDDMCYSCEAGDVNCDHKINILDFIRFKKNITDGLSVYSADLNGDGVNGLEDLILICKKLLGVIN